jgi:hypothetical protein
MKTGCETVYLDEKNNRASVYYNNLHLGHNIAYSQYLTYMKGKANTIVQNKTVSLDTIYHQPKNEKLEGVRKMINDSQTDVMSDGKIHTIAEDIVYRMKAKELIMSSPASYDYTTSQANSIIIDDIKIQINAKAIDDAKKFYLSEPEALKASIDTVKYNWSFHTDAGINIDKYVTSFLESYNKALLQSAEEPSLKHLLDELDLSKIATDKAKETMRENVLTVFKALKSFVDSRGLKNYEFIPQFRISNEQLQMQGIMDLVIHDRDNNRAIVIDYKFKEKGKEFLFNSNALGKMTGPFKTLFNNKKTQAELQLSGYKLLLEKAGLPTNNIDIYVLPLIGKPIKENGKITGYESIDPPKFEPLTYQRSLIGKYLKAKRKIDIDETIVEENGKHNSTKELLLDLTNGKIQPITYDMDHDIDYILRNGVIVDATTGKEYFRNTFTEKKEFFTSDDIDDRKVQLKEYLKNKAEDKDKLANNLISFFYEKEWPGDANNKFTKAKTLQAKQILEGLDSKDFTLQQIKNLYGFENYDPNILVAINSKTGEARLINASNEINKVIRFGDKRTSIFGKYMEDNTIASIYKLTGLESNSNNFKLIELAITALKLKQRNYISTVESLFVGTINGNANQNVPSVSSMSDIIPQLKIINDISGDNLNSEFKEILSDSSLDSGSNKIDCLKEFIKQISISSSYIPLKSSDFKDKIKASYDLYLNEEINKHEFLARLNEAQKIMYASLKPTIVANNPLLLAKNKEYSLLCDAILSVAEFSIDPGALTRKRQMKDSFNLYGNHDNPVMQQVYVMDQTAQQEVTRRFEHFYAEHNKLVKALKEDYNKRNPNKSTSITSVDQHEIFADLYVQNPNVEAKDFNNAYKLKSSTDPTLTKAQKDYINFFNEKIKSGFALSLSSEQIEKFDENWELGTVPIISASSENRMSRAVNAGEKFKVWGNTLKYQGVKQAKDVVNSLFYEIDSKFATQLSTDSGAQGSNHRRSKLGIDNEGKKIDSEKTPLIETNLEHILHRFMLENLMDVAYQSTFAVYNALQVKLLLEQDEHYKPTADLSAAVDRYIKLMIFDEYADDGKFGEGLDMAKNIATKAVMGLSIKQFLMETGQNTLGSMSLSINATIAKMFGSTDAFVKNPASIATAAAFTTFDSTRNDEKAKITLAITKEFKLFDSDTGSVKSKDYQATKKDAIFQSKWLMFLNSVPYRNAITQSFFVKMADDGILGAYSQKDGLAIYTPSKDTRFSEIFEKDGSLKKSVSSEKALDQMAYYESLRKDLNNEYDGIKEDGLINRPYSAKEMVVIKDYLMKAYGSMGKNGKIELQEHAVGRALLMYKSWLPAKIGNYWSTGAFKESKGRRVRVENPDNPNDFYYEFQAQWDEGILQTLNHVYIQVVAAYKEENGNILKGLSSKRYNMHQKANMRKLISDLLVLAAMILAILTAKNMGVFSSKQGKYFLKIANNSVADLNMLSIMNSTITNSPFALYGFVTRTMSSLVSAVHYGINEDFDEAIAEGSKITGATNFLYNVSN